MRPHPINKIKALAELVLESYVKHLGAILLAKCVLE